MTKKHGIANSDETDYLYQYFMDEQKINDQLRDEMDEEMEQNREHENYDIDGQHDEIDYDSENSQLSASDRYEFNNSEQSNVSEMSERGIEQSPYRRVHQSINRNNRTEHGRIYRTEKNVAKAGGLMLGQELVGDIQKHIETPEEKRARAREAYTKLQNLVERYDVVLTRNYTMDSDPDEMEQEYLMHHSSRKRNNKIKFYKSLLLNCVCGIEFVNGKYNPFEFKLDDWSKQVALDMDDYTEIIEEIYDSHQGMGKEMRPEFRLIFMLAFSAITYHVSKSLFGTEGMGAIINQNPGLMNNLAKKYMKSGKGDQQQNVEPPPDNDGILAAIRRNKKKQESETESNKSEKYSQSDIKRLLTEQNNIFKNELKRRDDYYNNQLHGITQRMERNNYERKKKSEKQKKKKTENNSIILSDKDSLPRYMNSVSNKSIRREPSEESDVSESSEESNVTESEKNNEEISISRYMNSGSEFDLKMSSENFENNKKSVFQSINDIDNIGNTLDSLSNMDSDVDKMVSSDKKKRQSRTKSIRKTNIQSTSKRGTTEKGKSSGAQILKI